MSRRLGALLGLLAAAGCGGEPPPNLLLIVVDTLRRDALGVYGAERDTSPALDAFAAGAVRFERAYAPAPWTLPSVASLLTGLHPGGHGVSSPRASLPAEAETLAERLSARGYATAGVVSHVALGTRSGFDQGHARYRDSEARGHDYISTEGVTRQALELLDELAAGGAPFFLFVHYFDPHYDYERHPEVGFAPPAASRVDGSEPVMELQRRLEELDAADVALLRALYHEEVRHTDAGIGRLLDRLAALGLAERTLVAVSADHGEEFMERGWLGHTRTLYDELVRVPLLIRAPGVRPAVVAEPVSLVSLTPTLLELLGIEVSGQRFHAPSLAELVRGEAPAPGDAVLTQVDYVPIFLPQTRTHKSALVAGRHKLIRDEASGRLELYDLLDDPGEWRDLSSVQPELTSRLAAQLDDRLRRTARGRLGSAPREVSPEELELLRGLGYAGEEPDAKR